MQSCTGTWGTASRVLKGGCKRGDVFLEVQPVFPFAAA